MSLRRWSTVVLAALTLLLAAVHPVTAQARSQSLRMIASPAPTEKDPATAALLSLLITGGGQIYNEETLKGGLMLAGSVLGAAMAIDGTDEYDCDPEENCVPALLPIGVTTMVALKVWSLVDAAAGARRWNRAHAAGATVTPMSGIVALPDGRVGVSLLAVRW